MSRTFTTADILSCSTSRLCGQMGGVYEVLSHLAGRPLYTHELPKAFGVFETEIKRQLPWTAGLAEPQNAEECKALVAKCVEAHGSEHTLTPAPHLWEPRDKGVLGNLKEAAPHFFAAKEPQ